MPAALTTPPTDALPDVTGTPAVTTSLRDAAVRRLERSAGMEAQARRLLMGDRPAGSGRLESELFAIAWRRHAR